MGRKYTAYAAQLAKVLQAERAATDDEIPVAVLKAPKIHDENALVVMRLPTFLEWFGPSPLNAEPPHCLDCKGDES